MSLSRGGEYVALEDEDARSSLMTRREQVRVGGVARVLSLPSLAYSATFHHSFIFSSRSDIRPPSRPTQAEAVDDMDRELGSPTDAEYDDGRVIERPATFSERAASKFAAMKEATKAAMCKMKNKAKEFAAVGGGSASSSSTTTPAHGVPPSQRREVYGDERFTPPPEVITPAMRQARLAERLDAAAAAAEILFECRVASSSGDRGDDDHSEMLTQLRATCEEHLNALASEVESGGVEHEQMLARAIEVAEQLVAAIGDDDDATATAEPGGSVDSGVDSGGGGSGGGGAPAMISVTQDATPPPTPPPLVDLLAGLDVGGPPAPPPAPVAPIAPAAKAPPPPESTPQTSERPSSREEEEAMIAAAIAASLAESRPAPEQPAPAPIPPPPAPGGGGGGGNLIDI